MLNDKHTKLDASSKKGKAETMKEQKGINQLKSLDFDSSSGFVCDINTGICGPVIQKEEEHSTN